MYGIRMKRMMTSHDIILKEYNNKRAIYLMLIKSKLPSKPFLGYYVE
jgi:hypothetical protein